LDQGQSATANKQNFISLWHVHGIQDISVYKPVNLMILIKFVSLSPPKIGEMHHMH
jgi:hypothetical protein